MTTQVDVTGKPLEVGDLVVTTGGGRHLSFGVILRFTPKMVEVGGLPKPTSNFDRNMTCNRRTIHPTGLAGAVALVGKVSEASDDIRQVSHNSYEVS